MKIEQFSWSTADGWTGDKPFGGLGASAQLVLVFSGAAIEPTNVCIEKVRAAYPEAQVCGCSTSGEILGTSVLDESVVVTALSFEQTQVRATLTAIPGAEHSFASGETAAKSMLGDDLAHILVLSEGLKVNASHLLQGLNSILPTGVTLSGGFAGDSDRFQTTHVWCDGEPQQSAVVAIGFYGKRVRVQAAATGGWDVFGPDRNVTKSKGNVLYEFDGVSALSLYKEYLGEDAKGLPAIGLLYPIELRILDTDERVLRTVLAVDEEEQSITFAGEIPQGCVARLMFGNVKRLVDGVISGARNCKENFGQSNAQFALLVSCVGRRPVFKQRIEEEVEAIADIFEPGLALTGFYSYGEIAPTMHVSKAEVHNQTMTLTCFSEDLD